MYSLAVLVVVMMFCAACSMIGAITLTALSQKYRSRRLMVASVVVAAVPGTVGVLFLITGGLTLASIALLIPMMYAVWNARRVHRSAADTREAHE